MRKLILIIFISLMWSGTAYSDFIDFLTSKTIRTSRIYWEFDNKKYTKTAGTIINWNFRNDGTADSLSGDKETWKNKRYYYNWKIIGERLVRLEETPETRKSFKYNIQFNLKDLTMYYEDERFTKDSDKFKVKEKIISFSPTEVAELIDKKTERVQIINTNTNAQQDIMFTIKDKREQCEAIGFKPETEKFADCVLRLVELDVKKQTQNQIVNAQNSGNEALVRQLERQNNIQSSQALIDLGQQLMKPKQYNSNIYLPQTQRCTIQGFGTFAKMVCR